MTVQTTNRNPAQSLSQTFNPEAVGRAADNLVSQLAAMKQNFTHLLESAPNGKSFLENDVENFFKKLGDALGINAAPAANAPAALTSSPPPATGMAPPAPSP